MKKFLLILISCSLLSAIIISGCNKENRNDDTQISSYSETVTGEPTEKFTDMTTQKVTEKSTEKSTQITNKKASINNSATEKSQGNNQEIIIDNDAHENYEFVDETVDNPTVAPYEESHNNSENSDELTVSSFKGQWKPLTVTRVSDNSEISFNEAFGSIYSQYGGSLDIDENGNFQIKMGALIDDDKSQGKFTLSQYNLIVTYKNQSPDTFLYIPRYQNHKVIKVQISDYYVYFYKE